MSRLTYRHAAAACLLATLIAPAACRREADYPTDPQVTYGQFCTRTGTAFCGCVGVAVPECAQLFSVPCLGGRDPNAISDRTESQTATCERALGAGCTMVVSGGLPPECPQLASLALPWPGRTQ